MTLKPPTYEQMSRLQWALNAAVLLTLFAILADEAWRTAHGLPAVPPGWAGAVFALSPLLLLAPQTVFNVVMLHWSHRRFLRTLAELERQAHLYAAARAALELESRCTPSSSSH